MGWGALFFSFSGRINRARYWLALVLLSLAFLLPLTVVYVIMWVAADNDAAVLMHLAIGMGFVFFIVYVVSGAAIAAKRLHDRDKSAWWLLLFCLTPAIAEGIADAAGNAGVIFHVIGSAIALWALIELGFLRGTAGPNDFGPDPLTTTAAQLGGAHSMS